MISSPPLEEHSKAKILLVDDHPENLLALESLLGGIEADLVRANSGHEALKSVLDDEFALVLLDIQMPGMNGYETASLIRTRERSRHTPIIFLTAIYTTNENVYRGYAAGGTDYITKPLDGDVLKAKVASFIHMAKNTRKLEREVARRSAAERKQREVNAHLENLVKKRTAELKSSAVELASCQSQVAELTVKLRGGMTETHHRIKNSLQVIAALIDLQIMQDTPSIAPQQVRQLGINVKALALVHDHLTRESLEDGLTPKANAGEVLKNLLRIIQQTSPNRPITVNVTDLMLESHQLSSVALITSEAIANAIKFGTGAIAVNLSAMDGQATLIIENEGSEFPPEFDPNSQRTTGIELLQALSEWDLQGHIRYSNTPAGARVTLTFPQNAATA